MSTGFLGSLLLVATRALSESLKSRPLITPSPEPRAPSPDRYTGPLHTEMNFLDKLNPEQREAVLHRDGALLILAGAGSGKTRVITYRIAYLIGDGHAKPDEVLAVTFTNKAAQEMRERVEALIGDEAGGVWLSTFHSLCARLLRREAPKIGLSRDFVIYDSSDQVAVVKQAQRELGIDDKPCPRAWRCRASARPRTAWRGPIRCAASGTCATSRSPRSTRRSYDPQGLQRARLRRSPAQDGGAVRVV